MLKIRLLLPVLAGLFVPPMLLCAAETNAVVAGYGSPTNPAVTLPDVTVTATRIPAAVEDTPDSITVISAAQIAQSQQHLVTEVLRGQPGVEVARTGRPGSLDSVFLRGANNNQTLVLVDGIRVNNAFNNGFDFSQLAVDNVERIEILRGPQSTLYGSEAAGGVINIVTKGGGGPPAGWVETEYGSFNTLLTHGGFSAGEGKWSVAADGSYASSDNDRPNSDYRQYHFDGHARYDISDHFSIALLATYFHNDDGSPNDIYTDDPTARLKTENALAGLVFQGDPVEWWNTKLTLSHSVEHGTFHQPMNAENFFTDYFSRTTARRNQADFQNVFTPAEHHTILAGGTFENAAGDFSADGTYGPSALARTINTRSAYAQYDFTPVKRLTLTAGGRVDDSSSFGTHETYRFGGRVTVPGTETTLRATVGTGFRAPSISDLYFPGFSNPNLKPEESLGWDVGLEQPLAENRLRLGGAFFHNDFHNLIQYSAAMFAPENIGRARTYGVETFAAWQVATNLTARAGYTWLEATDLDTGARLVRRPKHSGSVNLNWQICPELEADANALFTGQSADFNYDNFSQPFNVTNPNYTKVDLALRWRAQKHLEFFVRGENLLDRHYEEVYGFPALGRGFFGGLRAQF